MSPERRRAESNQGLSFSEAPKKTCCRGCGPLARVWSPLPPPRPLEREGGVGNVRGLAARRPRSRGWEYCCLFRGESSHWPARHFGIAPFLALLFRQFKWLPPPQRNSQSTEQTAHCDHKPHAAGSAGVYGPAAAPPAFQLPAGLSERHTPPSWCCAWSLAVFCWRAEGERPASASARVGRPQLRLRFRVCCFGSD